MVKQINCSEVFHPEHVWFGSYSSKAKLWWRPW